MGEMADYHLDSYFCWEDDFMFSSGKEKTPQTCTCKFCGEKSLHWQQLNGKWRLYKGEEVHVCDKYRKEAK